MEMTLKGDYFDQGFHQRNEADETIKKICPANKKQVLWEAQVSYSHIEAVVNSAKQGFEAWRKLSFEQRIDYLKKFQASVQKRKDDIAKAIAWEVGKPYWEALTEAAALDGKVNVTINDSLARIQTKTTDNILPQVKGHTLFKPHGVSLVIGPFNFPCHLANGQILSSLLAGNSVIFKPSEKTIYSAQLLIECFHEAGFPPGVINLINGTAHTSSSLVEHPVIKAVFFTGSKAVGLKILEKTHKNLHKMVALELGGKNATIIHKDAHLEHALVELMRSAYLTTGQRCTSTSHVFVHEKIKDQVIDEFKKLTERIIVDHPVNYQTEPFMGPLIDEYAQKLYLDAAAMGTKIGAQELVKAKVIDDTGYYVSASLSYLEKPDPRSKYFQQEIFGPHCCLIPYSDLEEAIELANATEYGLASAIFTADLKNYELAKRDLQAGLINLNRSTVGASAKLPFGGVKSSGNFRPAAVAMIDHCVASVSSLETLDTSSQFTSLKGLKA